MVGRLLEISILCLYVCIYHDMIEHCSTRRDVQTRTLAGTVSRGWCSLKPTSEREGKP